MPDRLVVHRLNTGWLESRDGIGLLGEGRRAGAEPLRQHGWTAKLRRPDGTVVGGTMVPAPAWYIEGAGRSILVDTGMGGAEEVLAAQAPYGLRLAASSAPEDDIVERLDAIGVAAEQIDVVIHTHLHFDHVGADERFPNARFLVHRDELAWALCPPPYYETFYYPAYAHHVAAVLDRIDLMTGDEHHVAPGVRVVRTAGHSPGHCSVFVETAVGLAAIAGDAVANYRNLEHDWPGGINFDVEASVRAIQILKRAPVLLVNHDPSFAAWFPTGRVGDEPLEPATRDYMRELHHGGSLGRVPA